MTPAKTVTAAPESGQRGAVVQYSSAVGVVYVRTMELQLREPHRDEANLSLFVVTPLRCSSVVVAA